MIEREVWGEIAGQPVYLWHLACQTAIGMVRIAVADHGATLQTFEVPDGRGRPTDIVLGHDSLADYIAANAYFGAIVGRYGNRIKDGLAVIDGHLHQLDRNEGAHHLHGGRSGFDRRLWQGHAGEDGRSLVFTLVSPDGDMGFPGRLEASVIYALTAAGGLRVEMTARTDRTTLCNLVQHSYFNLAGCGDITGHIARFSADFYTPVGADLLATGEIRSVAGTPFDFRQPRTVGRDLGSTGSKGYDHNFVLGTPGPDGLRDCATILCPSNGLGLALRTTEPGVQFYTGGYLSESVIGKGGRACGPFAGLALESQVFPCSPGHAHFPQAILQPQQTYRHVMDIALFHAESI